MDHAIDQRGDFAIGVDLHAGVALDLQGRAGFGLEDAAGDLVAFRAGGGRMNRREVRAGGDGDVMRLVVMIDASASALVVASGDIGGGGSV